MDPSNRRCLDCAYSRLELVMMEYVCLQDGNYIYDPFDCCDKFKKRGDEYAEE